MNAIVLNEVLVCELLGLNLSQMFWPSSMESLMIARFRTVTAWERYRDWPGTYVTLFRGA